MLASRHCDILQGYFFSKPLPAAELEQFLRTGHSMPANLTGRASNAPLLLLQDDETLVLEYLSLVLGNEGDDVRAMSDPLRAFELLACHEFAVVLRDQRMPAMDGIAFLSRVKSMHPATIRIIHSAFDDALVTREAINRGAVYKFVDKSANNLALIHAVKDGFDSYLARRTTSHGANPAGATLHG